MSEDDIYGSSFSQQSKAPVLMGQTHTPGSLIKHANSVSVPLNVPLTLCRNCTVK